MSGSAEYFFKSVAGNPSGARTNGPPNVVISYADDLGYADINRNKSTGSLAYTPHIDRICNEEIYLSSYMTHHVCSPTHLQSPGRPMSIVSEP